ncbi:NADPH:quinone oxidoreductase family protein [Colwellia demingiae]|uniref:NADPH:quinone oxidoreductase family protein n=1 Tax=Colwellia demingiae TaxID=89401 RepID=A0A5C6QHE7_9GAMM|nr:NADPH:quinone oxidoreductase family protein [Colwellia demingiae]TWX68080.1 NADPH:quinone oxidoreductase family protein [Colwellia demingiae]
MKAIVCNEFSELENLALSDVESPQAKAGQVVLNIEAAGVNFPDGLLVQGLYQMKPPTPFIPGSEVAGTVATLGEGVTHLKEGQRVVCFCMLGGFAEQVAVDARMVMPLPQEIASTEAAGLLTAHATAHHALRQRGNLAAGETLLVTGAAGGTGLAAIQIGKAIGANVIAVCSSDEKLAIAQENGADILINSSEVDVKSTLKSVTEGKGVDVAYDCVGGELFNACLSNMAWNGRLLVVGFASGDIPKVSVNLTLVKGCSVVGVFWGTFTQKQPKDFMLNMHELLQWYQEGKVKVVIDEIFELSATVNAINKLMSRKVKGKVIITP